MSYKYKNEKIVYKRLKQYPDLYNYSRFQSAKRITASVIWYGFWFFTYYIYFFSSQKRLIVEKPVSLVLVSISIVVIIMPFNIFKVHKIITDRSYDGIIKDVKQEYKIKVLVPGGSYLSNLKEQECLSIITEDDLGKLHDYIYWEKDDINNQAYFKKGAKVTHYKEFKYLHNIDREEGEQLCVVCGQFVINDRDTCARCKHSFIK